MIRWTPRLKAEIIMRVRSGAVKLAHVLVEHEISYEEYRDWELLYDRAGVKGLRSSRLQDHRPQAHAAARRRAQQRIRITPEELLAELEREVSVVMTCGPRLRIAVTRAEYRLIETYCLERDGVFRARVRNIPLVVDNRDET